MAVGRPTAISAGAIWASESLPIEVIIGRDSSRYANLSKGMGILLYLYKHHVRLHSSTSGQSSGSPRTRRPTRAVKAS